MRTLYLGTSRKAVRFQIIMAIIAFELGARPPDIRPFPSSAADCAMQTNHAMLRRPSPWYFSTGGRSKPSVSESPSPPANVGLHAMAWSNLLLSFYTLICLFFIDNSYREGEAAGGAWDAMRVLGLVLCLVWPLLLVHVIISAYRDRQTG